MSWELKKDDYRKARGGYSRFLQLGCVECGEDLLTYQKDGPGPLKRLYVDRILLRQGIKEPEPTAGCPLSCTGCGAVVGVFGIYEKENRFAYRLFAHSVKSSRTTRTKGKEARST
jgi:ribosomal protein S27E